MIGSRVKENADDTLSKTSPDCEPDSCSPAVSLSVPVVPDSPISPVSDVWLVNLCASVCPSLSASHRRIGPEVLSVDLLFERLLAEAGSCSACLLAAPHATFNAALRGVTPPDIYGLKGLTSDTKATVRKETLVALRIADLAKDAEIAAQAVAPKSYRRRWTVSFSAS